MKHWSSVIYLITGHLGNATCLKKEMWFWQKRQFEIAVREELILSVVAFACLFPSHWFLRKNMTAE
jgi:hypothetical protein